MKRAEVPGPLLGAFEEQVMLAVLRKGEEAYGMAVRRELEKVTQRSITIGSVYVTLDRLEAKGLVSSTRSTLPARVAHDESVSRRVFGVTREGGRALVQTREVRERLWRGVLRRSLVPSV
jgi:PadR family transcriptional regulator PadR